MPIAKRWTVDIDISEHTSGETVAQARLHTRDATDLRGNGRARKHPSDANVPEIGDELASARALSDLAHRLLEAAADDIEAVTHEKVTELAE